MSLAVSSDTLYSNTAGLHRSYTPDVHNVSDNSHNHCRTGLSGHVVQKPPWSLFLTLFFVYKPPWSLFLTLFFVYWFLNEAFGLNFRFSKRPIMLLLTKQIALKEVQLMISKTLVCMRLSKQLLYVIISKDTSSNV